MSASGVRADAVGNSILVRPVWRLGVSAEAEERSRIGVCKHRSLLPPRAGFLLTLGRALCRYRLVRHLHDLVVDDMHVGISA